MQIIPAIDLMNGKVVRLLRGEPSTKKSYEHQGDPVTIARKWESEGAGLLHIVDLDAPFGFGSNAEVVMAIADSVKVPVQVGGGIRSLEVAKNYLEKGIYRIILGSLAFEDSSKVKLVVDDFGSDRVAVALDHLYGKVMVGGWKAPTDFRVDEAISIFSSLGFRFFLVTSVARDGTLMGPDLDTLSKVCSFPGVHIMAAGGISNLEDLINLRRIGVYGVVIGKALYEERICLKDALRISGEG